MSTQKSLESLKEDKQEKKILDAVFIADPNSYCCYTCLYDMDKDFGRFDVVYRRGKMRVKLKRIALTLYVCPKCHSTYFDDDFVVEEYHKVRQRKKKMLRLEHLKQIYR